MAQELAVQTTAPVIDEKLKALQDQERREIRISVWRESLVKSMPNHPRLHEAFDKIMRTFKECGSQFDNIVEVRTSDHSVWFNIEVKGTLWSRNVEKLLTVKTPDPSYFNLDGRIIRWIETNDDGFTELHCST